MSQTASSGTPASTALDNEYPLSSTVTLSIIAPLREARSRRQVSAATVTLRMRGLSQPFGLLIVGGKQHNPLHHDLEA